MTITFSHQTNHPYRIKQKRKRKTLNNTFSSFFFLFFSSNRSDFYSSTVKWIEHNQYNLWISILTAPGRNGSSGQSVFSHSQNQPEAIRWAGLITSMVSLDQWAWTLNPPLWWCHIWWCCIWYWIIACTVSQALRF